MKADNDLYRQLRELPAAQLWNEEVPKFNLLGAKERNQQVALVRAVGVVFSTSRNPEMKAAVKAWMIGLLQDPSEKIRRYATAAIPKLGGDEASEQKLLDILQTTEVEREKKKVASALEKIGGGGDTQGGGAIRRKISQRTEITGQRGPPRKCRFGENGDGPPQAARLEATPALPDGLREYRRERSARSRGPTG